MFVDQPTGTGFSYTANNTSDIRSDEVGISNDLYDFLQVCLFPMCVVCVLFNEKRNKNHGFMLGYM